MSEGRAGYELAVLVGQLLHALTDGWAAQKGPQGQERQDMEGRDVG